MGSDWIQVWSAATLSATLGVLTFTLIGVFWYASQTRRQADATIGIGQETNEQARATQRLAEASLRPALEQWIEETPANTTKLYVHYRNYGNGPAVNIRWTVQPSGINSPERVGLGLHRDPDGPIEFDLNAKTPPERVVAEYDDLYGKPRASILILKEHDGKLQNGPTTHTERSATV